MQFDIVTSRAITTRLETNDPSLDLDEAMTVASALHREIIWEDTTGDGMATGTYVHNGRTEHIAVIDTATISATDWAATIAWVNLAND